MKRLLKYVLLLSTLSAMAHARAVTVEHAMGVTEIDKPPMRIVTLYQGATDAAIALGIKPVAVVESWVEKPIYKYLRPELEGVVLVGSENQPNLEEIAKLKPDLIIASKLRHAKIYQHLSLIAPTVTHESVYKYKETLDLVAKATFQQEKGQQVLEQWTKRTESFQAKMKAKLGRDWPQEATLVNFRPDHARLYYTSFGGLVLQELGFTRPEKHQQDTWGVKLTSKESIPDMNAKTFFVFMDEANPIVQQNYHSWSSHPLWKALDAVKTEQVYFVDSVAWNMSGGILGANLMLDQLNQHYQLAE